MNKYELTSETKTLSGGIVLHRIKALKDFADVRKGDLGGWIESENNLSHEGNCWIYDEAMCYNKARVYDNGSLHNYAVASKYALVHDNAALYNCAYIENAYLMDNAKAYGKTHIYDAHIGNNAVLKETADYIHINGVIDITSYMSDGEIMISLVGYRGAIDEIDIKDFSRKDKDYYEKFIELFKSYFGNKE